MTMNVNRSIKLCRVVRHVLFNFTRKRATAIVRFSGGISNMKRMKRKENKKALCARNIGTTPRSDRRDIYITLSTDNLNLIYALPPDDRERERNIALWCTSGPNLLPRPCGKGKSHLVYSVCTRLYVVREPTVNRHLMNIFRTPHENAFERVEMECFNFVL